jgi:hypothetical protein
MVALNPSQSLLSAPSNVDGPAISVGVAVAGASRSRGLTPETLRVMGPAVHATTGILGVADRDAPGEGNAMQLRYRPALATFLRQRPPSIGRRMVFTEPHPVRLPKSQIECGVRQ